MQSNIQRMNEHASRQELQAKEKEPGVVQVLHSKPISIGVQATRLDVDIAIT